MKTSTMSSKNHHAVTSKSDGPHWASREDELFARLGADIKQGLSAAEATKRLETLGPNAIARGKQTPAWNSM